MATTDDHIESAVKHLANAQEYHDSCDRQRRTSDGALIDLVEAVGEITAALSDVVAVLQRGKP